MKYKPLVLVLLALFNISLFSCGPSGGSSSEESSISSEEESSVPYFYEMTYGGKSKEVIPYDSTFQIQNILFDNESHPEFDLEYRVKKDYNNIITVSSSGLVTAAPYSPSNPMGNINELVEVSVTSSRAKNALTITFAVVLLEENVSFNKIFHGENYHYFTSTGIIEELVLWDYDSTRKGYADCTLREEGTGEVFETTITKNYTIDLDSTIKTSHFRTVIKRDEYGAESMKNVKNGTKVKFLTMMEYAEETQVVYKFNTIVTEIISESEDICTITNYNSAISVDKTSGHYDESFTVTSPKNTLIHVLGTATEINYYDTSVTEDTRVSTYLIKSKNIRIYTDDNLKDENLVLVDSFIPNNTYEGELGNNAANVSEYLFGSKKNEYSVHTCSNISRGGTGLFIGSSDSSTSGNLSFTIPKNKHINKIVVTYSSISSGKLTTIHFRTRNSIGDRTATSSSLTLEQFYMPLSEYKVLTDYVELEIWVIPRRDSGTKCGCKIAQIDFYSFTEVTPL